MERSKKIWTQEEIEFLRWNWGVMKIPTLSTKLSRSKIAIHRKASALKLGGLGQNTTTFEGLSKKTGYAASTILVVMKNLNLDVRRIKRYDTRPGFNNVCRRAAISAEQEQKIVAYLKQYGSEKIHRHDGKRSPKGMWGVGLKSQMCSECGRNDRPHYAKNKCRSCYNRSRKRNNQTQTQTQS